MINHFSNTHFQLTTSVFTFNLLLVDEAKNRMKDRLDHFQIELVDP